MTIRYIIAIVLTILLLVFARRMSTRHAIDLTTEVDGVMLAHHTVTENFGDGPKLEVKSNYTSAVRAVVFYSERPGDHYEVLDMAPVPDGFYAKLPALEKGRKWSYHIEFYKDNVKIAQFPEDADQLIKFKGKVSLSILIPHIFFMFATIFFGILTVFTAIDHSRGRARLSRSVRFLLLTLVSAFLGGFPFGIAVTYQTFGEGWGGWPIGKDWTDTKTEIFFLFWLITFFLSIRGLKGESMRISNRTYLFLVITSFVVTFITFLIPHSI